MSSEEKLMPCPFCGCDIHLDYDPKHGYFGPEGAHKLGCFIGTIDFRDFADEHHAITAWNTRPARETYQSPNVPEEKQDREMAYVWAEALGIDWRECPEKLHTLMQGFAVHRVNSSQRPAREEVSGEREIVAIDVIQLDRDAAADVLFHVDGDPFVSNIRDGIEDDSYLVKRFAEHRIAAMTPKPAEAENADLATLMHTDPGSVVFERVNRPAADVAAMREALADLVSWFDGGPSSYGPWIIKAGQYGADDAVHAARRALGREEDPEGGA